MRRQELPIILGTITLVAAIFFDQVTFAVKSHFVPALVALVYSALAAICLGICFKQQRAAVSRAVVGLLWLLSVLIIIDSIRRMLAVGL